MKINGRDYTATAVPAAGCAGAAVRIDVKAYGFPLTSEHVSPDKARELAALLVMTADLAEGKAKQP